MKFEKYLKIRKEMFDNQPKNKETFQLLWASNSLAGEVGEFANIVKKIYRDHDGNIEAMWNDLEDELGDIMWYWLFVCDIINIKPEAIFNHNIEKLRDRYK